MKSLRLTLAAFLLAGIATVHAADSQKDSTPADKTSASDSKKTSAKSDKKDSAKSDKKASPEKSATLPDPVAVVEGVPIKKAELEKEFADALAAVGKPASDLTATQKQQGYHEILDQLIIRRLLDKRAADVKVTDEEVDKRITQFKTQMPEDKFNEQLKKSGLTLDKLKENIRTSLKQQMWIESQIANKTAVSDADAQAFYDKNIDKFKQPETVRASHILFLIPPDSKPDVTAEKEKLAKATEERIKKGEDFAKLATELSDDKGTKENGGSLDFFARGEMVPEFSDAAFKLKVGEVSDPVKTQYGYHIIKVTGKKDARTVPFEETKERLVAYLKDQKSREAVNELISTMRKTADVKVNLAPLPTPSPDKQLAPAP